VTISNRARRKQVNTVKARVFLQKAMTAPVMPTITDYRRRARQLAMQVWRAKRRGE